MEDRKATIVKLFFEKHNKVKDITSLLCVYSVYITNVIKTDVRYNAEKLARLQQ